MNSGGQPTATNAARILATKSAQSGRKVLLCDTTGQSGKDTKEENTAQISGLTTKSVNENFSVLTETYGGSFFTSKTFNLTIKKLTERFDQVFVCTSNKNAQLGLMALSELSPSIVMISSLRKTKKNAIKNIKTRQPIDLLFYD